MHVTDATVRKLVVPERYVSDSQVAEIDYHVGGASRRVTDLEYAYVELETDTDHRGVGFAVVNMEAPGDLPAATLAERFRVLSEEVVGESPFGLVNGLSRHRGGQRAYYGGGSYGTGLRRAVDFALWDLCGKRLGEPVYRLLGGDDPNVPVYASGLAYPASDEEVRDLYERFADFGIRAAKVKVGYPTVEEDLDRLALVRDTLGGDPTLMIDANEGWSAKETIRRVRAYREHGFDLYWVEDPVLPTDVEGMRKVADDLSFTNLTIGDYLSYEEKRQVLESGACDILNVHGFSPGWKDAHLANAFGVPLGAGTDHSVDIAPLHVGAAYPETAYMEFTGHVLYDLADRPYEFEDGHAVAPDRPGHGVEFDDDVLDEYTEEP